MSSPAAPPGAHLDSQRTDSTTRLWRTILLIIRRIALIIALVTTLPLATFASTSTGPDVTTSFATSLVAGLNVFFGILDGPGDAPAQGETGHRGSGGRRLVPDGQAAGGAVVTALLVARPRPPGRLRVTS